LELTLAKMGPPSRVRSGYRVEVTVYEEKDGQLLDLGVYSKPVVLESKAADGKLTGNVTGVVRGDITVGIEPDRDRVDLKSFKVSDGKKLKVPLWADPGVRLKVEAKEPAYMEVTLENKGPSANGRVLWDLGVTIPPRRASGGLPRGSSITL